MELPNIVNIDSLLANILNESGVKNRIDHRKIMFRKNLKL